MENMSNELLRQKLVQFKKITENLIKDINNELTENIDRLFIDRQEVINDIEKNNYTKAEFTKLCDELKILEDAKELDNLVVRKCIEVRNKINNLNERKIANRSYDQSTYKKTSFFSTKI